MKYLNDWEFVYSVVGVWVLCKYVWFILCFLFKEGINLFKNRVIEEYKKDHPEGK